mmetsp:Transcript_91998/g.297642  ORF Transcript_91998/g.297642 Transcript_91998/m.297642 type:complete len:331 (+) Transcript_91998:1063-2055(+)
MLPVQEGRSRFGQVDDPQSQNDVLTCRELEEEPKARLAVVRVAIQQDLQTTGRISPNSSQIAAFEARADADLCIHRPRIAFADDSAPVNCREEERPCLCGSNVDLYVLEDFCDRPRSHIGRVLVRIVGHCRITTQRQRRLQSICGLLTPRLQQHLPPPPPLLLRCRLSDLHHTRFHNASRGRTAFAPRLAASSAAAAPPSALSRGCRRLISAAVIHSSRRLRFIGGVASVRVRIARVPAATCRAAAWAPRRADGWGHCTKEKHGLGGGLSGKQRGDLPQWPRARRPGIRGAPRAARRQHPHERAQCRGVGGGVFQKPKELLRSRASDPRP